MKLYIFHMKFNNNSINYDFSDENVVAAENEDQALRLLMLKTSLLAMEAKEVYVRKNWTIKKLGEETTGSGRPYIVMKKRDNEDYFNLI